MFLKSILDKFDKKNSCGHDFINQNISSYGIAMFDMT